MIMSRMRGDVYGKYFFDIPIFWYMFSSTILQRILRYDYQSRITYTHNIPIPEVWRSRIVQIIFGENALSEEQRSMLESLELAPEAQENPAPEAQEKPAPEAQEKPDPKIQKIDSESDSEPDSESNSE